MRIAIITLAGLLVCGLTGPARAQDPALVPATHEELGGLMDDMAGQFHTLGERLRGHFGGPGAAGQRPLISIMLSHRDQLGLTAPQVQALERLRAEFQKEAIRREADIRVAETDVATLLQAEPVDVAKVEAKVREADQHRTELRVARIRVIEEGKAQLTSEQRQKLAELAPPPGRSTARQPRPLTAPPAAGPERPQRI